MRSICYLILISVFTLGSFNALSQEVKSALISFQLEGEIGGKAYLIGQFCDQYYRADSSSIDPSGKMSFQRDSLYHAGLYFIYVNNAIAIQVLLDDDQVFAMKTKKEDPIKFMSIDGSLENDLLYKNLKFEQEIDAKFKAVAAKMAATTEGTDDYLKIKAEQDRLISDRKAHLEQFKTQYPTALFTRFKMAGQNPEVQNPLKPDGSVDTDLQLYLYRTAFWDNVDLKDERLLRTPVIANKLKRYMTELTYQQPDSIIRSADFLIGKVIGKNEYYKFFCNWIALNYEPEKTSVMDPQAINVHMVKHYFTNERAFWEDTFGILRLQMRAAEMESSLIGLKGPNVTAKDPNGILRSIYDIKSPYVIVYMYNPTCEHCMEETPKLVSFYQEWKSKGVEVYAIALHTDHEEWTNYIKETGANWINVFDPTNKAIYKKYYVDVTPEIYVLDSEKKIIAKNLKTHQIAEVIERDRKDK